MAAAQPSGDRSRDMQTHDPKMGMLEFKALAETIPSLVFMTDVGGSNIYTNVQFARFAGVSNEALLGDGWLDVIHPDDRYRAAKTCAHSFETGEPYDTRYRFRRFDGDYRWHVVRGSPLRDGAGEIMRWFGSCTDVDDMLSEISTKTNSEAVLAALGQGTGMILYAKDAEGRFIYANEATIETIGAPVEQIIGRSLDELAPGSEQAAAIRRHDALAQLTPAGVVVEEQWPNADGGMRTYRSRKAPMHLSDGTIGLAAATIEITNEKELSNAHRRAEERTTAWLDALPVAAFSTDADGRITAVNQRWLDTCGFPVRDADHTFGDLVVADFEADFARCWAAAVRGREIFEMRVQIFDHFEREMRLSHVTAFPASMLGATDSDAWYGSFS